MEQMTSIAANSRFLLPETVQMMCGQTHVLQVYNNSVITAGILDIAACNLSMHTYQYNTCQYTKGSWKVREGFNWVIAC